MIAIADVAVTVKNARTAAAWWKEKVGFETHTIGPPSGHALMVAPPGDRFVLHLCEGIEPVEPGNTGIAFVSDELETLTRRMAAAGVSFPEPYHVESWGGVAKFADPDGNIFWLLSAPSAFIREQVRRRASVGSPRRAVRRRRPSRSRPTPRRR
jgi:predicted enzyme related to lactoylglutathione lyase